jgi:hypothetical protein
MSDSIAGGRIFGGLPGTLRGWKYAQPHTETFSNVTPSKARLAPSHTFQRAHGDGGFLGSVTFSI